MNTFRCGACGNTFTFSLRELDGEIEIAPWPHITCPCCGNWIAVY